MSQAHSLKDSQGTKPFIGSSQKKTKSILLTAPERVREPAVDSAIELLVDWPDDARAQLDEVYDEAAHHKYKAHQQLKNEQALDVSQESHA